MNPKESDELHKFRLEYKIIIRKCLPPHLWATAFAHIICADMETGEHYNGSLAMARKLAMFHKRYKMPVVMAGTIRRNHTALVSMGLLEIHAGRQTVIDQSGRVRNTQGANMYIVNLLAFHALEPLQCFQTK